MGIDVFVLHPKANPRAKERTDDEINQHEEFIAEAAIALRRASETMLGKAIGSTAILVSQRIRGRGGGVMKFTAITNPFQKFIPHRQSISIRRTDTPAKILWSDGRVKMRPKTRIWS